MSLKRQLFEPIMDRIDLNGLNKTTLLSNSDCFALLYGSTLCRRCKHKVKVGKRWIQLKTLCKAFNSVLKESIEKVEETKTIPSILQTVNQIVKAEGKKEEAEKKQIKKVDLPETKRLKAINKAVSRYAKRKHSELDWVGALYEISERYGADPKELVEQFKETIRHSCNITTLRHLLKFSKGEYDVD